MTTFAEQSVVAALAIEYIGSLCAVQFVVTVATERSIIARAKIENIIAIVAIDLVGAISREDDVVAVAGMDLIISGTGHDAVQLVRAVQHVVPFCADDDVCVSIGRAQRARLVPRERLCGDSHATRLVDLVTRAAYGCE